ncbi:hypothetical protein CL617_00145, partial [archaeon]|nr:hypothetical protein [archaeon]
EEGKKYAYRIRAKTVFEGKTSYSNYLEPIGDNVFSPSLEYSVTASTIYDPNFPEQPTVQGELSEPGQPSQPSEQPSSSSVGDGGSGTSAGGRRDYGRSYPDVEDYGDTDNDGLPDNWEIENFVGLSQGADDDYDNDGFNNLNEYRTRSDPRASEDYGEDDSSNIAYFIIIGVVVFGVLGFFTFRKLHHKKPVMQNLETNGHAQQNVQENIPQGNQESPLQGLGESKHQGNQQEHLQHQEPQQESPIQGLGNIQQEHPQQNVEPHENSAQVSPELKDYITKMRKTGYKDQDIKNSLLEAGWDAHDVDNALKTVK